MLAGFRLNLLSEISLIINIAIFQKIQYRSKLIFFNLNRCGIREPRFNEFLDYVDIIESIT